MPLASSPDAAAIIPGPRTARYAKRRYSGRLRRRRDGILRKLSAMLFGDTLRRFILRSTTVVCHSNKNGGSQVARCPLMRPYEYKPFAAMIEVRAANQAVFFVICKNLVNSSYANKSSVLQSPRDHQSFSDSYSPCKCVCGLARPRPREARHGRLPA